MYVLVKKNEVDKMVSLIERSYRADTLKLEFDRNAKKCDVAVLIFRKSMDKGMFNGQILVGRYEK